MSTFSQFDANGYIGGSPGLLYRSRALFRNSGDSPTFIMQCFGIEVKDKPRYLFYRDDYAYNSSNSVPVYYHYFDALTGQTRVTANNQKTAGSQSIVDMFINPINGAIMSSHVTGPNSNLFQSTDYGANFTDLGFSSGGWNTLVGNETSGAWYDGTNFIVGTGGGSYFTTDGTSFSAQSPAMDRPNLAGNNYSSYSGRYYSGNLSNLGYQYRTSRTGSDTLVSGYNLVAMSRNGRYLIRNDFSTPSLQYSTDGGLSWSTFSNTPFLFTNQLYYFTYSGRCLASDTGEFTIISSRGMVYTYSFSEGRWINYGGFNSGLDTGGKVTRFGGPNEAESVLISEFTTLANIGSYYVYLSDFPTRPA